MDSEHSELARTAEILVEHLADSRTRLLSGEVAHGQHYEFAERAWSLHVHLRGALALFGGHLYPSAFAVLRTALEHHVVDHLLFLGNRYKRTVANVTDETLAEWQAALRGGTAAPDVLEVRRVGRDGAEIIRSGVHYEEGPKGPDAPGLSFYYGVLEWFDPFTGGKEAQKYIGQWAYREDSRDDWVARQGQSWKRNLAWRAPSWKISPSTTSTLMWR